jgi:hypothetical protein
VKLLSPSRGNPTDAMRALCVRVEEGVEELGALGAAPSGPDVTLCTIRNDMYLCIKISNVR